MLAVTTDREGAPRGETLRWGLVPSWAKQPDIGLKMINARVETVAERPAFARAFERYRCLIIADGFYEWQPMPGGPKQPFHITRDDGALFAFAGLWSIWHAPDGGTLRTCTILTHGGELGDRPAARPDAGDPRARRRGGVARRRDAAGRARPRSCGTGARGHGAARPSARPSTTRATTARSASRRRCRGDLRRALF